MDIEFINKCKSAAKIAKSLAEFKKLIGYDSKSGFHERTIIRINRICNIDLRAQIQANALKSKKHICKTCGKIFYEKYSKYSNGEFCCHSCANRYSSKFANSEENKKLKSLKLREYYKDSSNKRLYQPLSKEQKEKISKSIYNRHKHVTLTCPECGKQFTVTETQATKRKYCSGSCRNKATNKYKNGTVSKAENLLKKAISTHFPLLSVKYNDREELNGLELDVYIPSLKYAVEWNGIFHYVDVSGKLKSIQSRDIKKKELCAEKGICLRVIKDLKSSKKEIEAGISIVLNDLFGMGD